MQLTDFGLTRVLDVDKKTHVSTQTYGTVAYMLPELLSASRLTKSVSRRADASETQQEHAAFPALLDLLREVQQATEGLASKMKGTAWALLHA